SFGEPAMLFGDKGLYNAVHIHVPFEVIGFVEAAVGLTLGAAQVNEVDAIRQAGGHAGKIVIGANAIRAGTEAESVGRVIARPQYLPGVLFGADNAREAQDRVRRIVGMNGHADTFFRSYGDD